MKKLINKYKAWKHEQRRKAGQWYANLIISQLKYAIEIDNEWQFNYWMTQGAKLDAQMVGLYDIYLD